MNPVVLPLAYTGRRAEEFLPVRIALQAGDIDTTSRDYINAVRNLNVAQRRALAQDAKRRNERAAREQAAFEAAQAARVAQEAATAARRREAMDRRNAKKRAQRKIAKLENQYVPFEKVGEVVNEILKVTDQFGVLPSFTATFTSANVPGATFDLPFQAEGHFNNWLQRVSDEEFEEDSANITAYNDAVKSNGQNAFNNVRVSVTRVAGGCSQRREVNKECQTPYYDLTVYSPESQYNDCGLKCLEYITKQVIDYAKVREQFGLRVSEKIPMETLIAIYKTLGQTKPLVVIPDDKWHFEIIKNNNYIYLNKGHYSVVKHAEYRTFKDIHTKRGMLMWDIETRESEEFVMVAGKPSYILKDAITCIAYKKYKSDVVEHLTFVTTPEKSSVHQFKDWLSSECDEGRFYSCFAHNGSRFDHYFFLASLNEQEQLCIEPPQMRGRSIIGIQYKSHLFKDTCCFLTMSLKSLCKSFKVKNQKMTEFIHKGKKLTNENICFYNTDDTVKTPFWEFMALQYTDPDFWSMYTQYCLMDCISLMEVWEKFSACVVSITAPMFENDKERLSKVSLTASNTIGSLAKKIMENTQWMPPIRIGKSEKQNSFHTEAYMSLMRFIQKPNESDSKKKHVNDELKLKFIAKSIRGGISESLQRGKHNESVASVDIASQYPAAMMNMLVPSGPSEWGHDYDIRRKGYYHLVNLRFQKRVFNPVSCKKLDGTLEWVNETMDSLYTDSFMIDYLVRNCGLLSFEVAKNDKGEFESLTSLGYVKGFEIFGRFITPMYEEKRRQDALKDSGSEEYNPALRETIKLFLNSLSGKMVEDPTNYFGLKYVCSSDDQLNGVSIVKEHGDDKMNIWTPCGVMLYSYSKRLLFEYIKCLPNKESDVIATETDSIYFPARCLDGLQKNVAAYQNTHPNRWNQYPIKFGGELGNVKIEKIAKDPSYFISKKCYMIGDAMKAKGIPTKTIDMNGNEICLVDKSYYERLFAGEAFDTVFATLDKTLYGSKTIISARQMSRKTTPPQGLKEWN
jgi:hypothetical protein